MNVPAQQKNQYGEEFHRTRMFFAMIPYEYFINIGMREIEEIVYLSSILIYQLVLSPYIYRHKNLSVFTLYLIWEYLQGPILSNLPYLNYLIAK